MSTSFRVEHMAMTSSTNDDLKARARAGEPEGLVLVADCQTGGRGRLGRSFFSPGNCGLYASVLLRPSISLANVNRVTCLTAVVLCRVIRAMAKGSVGIKWVNDIYRNGKKVCGILTESASRTDGYAEYVVVGFGVNVNPPDAGYPPEISHTAGSVFDDRLHFSFRRKALLDGVLDGLSSYQLDLSSGDFLHDYRLSSILRHTPVTVLKEQCTLDATAMEIDEDGRLVVLYPDGRTEHLCAGDVSIQMR